ncbi:unnamed protein product, partial [Didymodactylos carnosus]
MILLYLFCLIPILCQCQQYNLLLPGHPPFTTRIIGNKEIVRENHPFMGTFSKISINGVFNVQLIYNDDENDNTTFVEIETDKNLQQFVLVEIQTSDTLIIRMKNEMNYNTNNIHSTNMTVYIKYKYLKQLDINGLVNLECLNQIQTEQFIFHNKGTGSVKLKLNVNYFDAFLHSIGPVKFCGQINDEATLTYIGVGDIDCSNLMTKKINVISSGIGNVHVVAADEINVTLSG